MGSLQPGAEAKTDWFKQMAKGERAWRQPSGERSHSREVQLGTHNQVEEMTTTAIEGQPFTKQQLTA